MLRSCRTRSSFTWIEGGISPTSSRKRVPPSASSKRPSLPLHRPGEGAALVAEQLGLEQPLGDGGAGDRDERLVAPRAGVVEGAGHQLLAGAGLARAAARWRRWRPPCGSAPAPGASAPSRPPGRAGRPRGPGPPPAPRRGPRSLRAPRRSRAISTAFSTRARSTSGGKGFSRKSMAPSCIASTAVAMVPWAEITSTVASGSSPAASHHLDAVHRHHAQVGHHHVGRPLAVGGERLGARP